MNSSGRLLEHGILKPSNEVECKVYHEQKSTIQWNT